VKLYDDYDFETLTVPAIVIGFPIAIALAILGFSLSSVLGFSILGVQALAFMLVPVRALIRSQGKRIESIIFEKGLPTSDLLKAEKANKSKIRQERRETVSRLSGVSLAAYSKAHYDREYEREIIDKAVSLLREKMRGREFNLLRRELKSYGYWRNMYAIRPVGIASSAISLLVGLLSVNLLSQSSSELSWVVWTVSTAALVLFLFFWIFLVKESSVQSAANNYSQQFFKSLVLLD